MNPTEREPGKDQPKPVQPSQPIPPPKKKGEEEPSETPGQSGE